MNRINYTQYQPFQDVFQKLPDEARETVEQGVQRFLQSDEAIVMEYGTEELPSASMLGSCQDDEFVGTAVEWEMTSFGRSEIFVSELEWALVDVHDGVGYDPFGLPRPLYTHHREFREILKKAPPPFKELVHETFARNDPSDTEFMLRSIDGYLAPLTFVAWSLGALPEADDELQDLIDKLGEAIDAINKKVTIARAEAFQRGEIPHEDGKRPTPVGWQ